MRRAVHYCHYFSRSQRACARCTCDTSSPSPPATSPCALSRRKACGSAPKIAPARMPRCCAWSFARDFPAAASRGIFCAGRSAWLIVGKFC